jgi:type IV secretory pathway TraG/TraD family ATPase VirD4
MTPMHRRSSLRVLTIVASGGFISIAVAVAMSVWRAREAKTAASYGSARWATLTEIRAAGLTASDGVVLGRFARDPAARWTGACAVLRADRVR